MKCNVGEKLLPINVAKLLDRYVKRHRKATNASVFSVLLLRSFNLTDAHFTLREIWRELW